MKLILHAGTHKTGTTSVQSALSENRAWLHRQGYTYPHLSDCGTSHNPFAHKLAVAGQEGLDDLKAELGAHLSNRPLILSAEEFSARIVGTRHWDGFDKADYWDRRRAYLERLRNVVAGNDTTVFLCFRRQDEYAAALYATNLSSDRLRWSFAEFRERCAPLFDYKAQAEAFRDVFQDVRIASFDSLKPDLVTHFLEWCSVPVPPRAARHTKLTPDPRVILWLYHRGVDDDGDQHRMRALFAHSKDAAGVFTERPRVTLWESEEAHRAFMARCTDPLPDLLGAPGSEERTVPLAADDALMAQLDVVFARWQERVASRGAPLRGLFRAARRALFDRTGGAAASR